MVAVDAVVAGVQFPEVINGDDGLPRNGPSMDATAIAAGRMVTRWWSGRCCGELRERGPNEPDLMALEEKRQKPRALSVRAIAQEGRGDRREGIRDWDPQPEHREACQTASDGWSPESNRISLRV